MTAIDPASLVSLFANNLDSVELGNRNINMFIGSFHLTNNRIRSIIPNDLVTLFDNQIGELAIGNATSVTKVGPFKVQLVTNAATMSANVL